MTVNIHETRKGRLATAWTEEFHQLKKRDRIPLILLIAILAQEVLRWFI